MRYIPNRPQADAASFELRGDVFDLDEADDPGYEGGGTINVPIVGTDSPCAPRWIIYDDPGFIDYNFLVREPGASNPQPDFSDLADVQRNLRSAEDANTEETLSGRLAVRYTDEWLDATLSYYYQDSDTGARQINHRASFGTGDYESAHRVLEPLERENELYSLELVADLGFAELTSATGYSEYERMDSDGTRPTCCSLWSTATNSFPASPPSPATRGKRRPSLRNCAWSPATTDPSTGSSGPFTTTSNWMPRAGNCTPGFDQFAVDNFGGVQLRPDALEFIATTNQSEEEKAVFGELGYRITPAWQVTVGARWFKFDNKQEVATATATVRHRFFGDPPDSINLDEQKPRWTTTTSFSSSIPPMISATT